MRSADETVAAAAAQAGAGSEPSDERMLSVSVVNGNLLFVQPPLLIGHYRDAALTGVEGVVDTLLGGALGASMRIGRYPQRMGTQMVFANPRRNDNRERAAFDAPGLPGVVVVGLGPEGQLRASELIATVRLGVIAWAQRLTEIAPGCAEPFELAATLVGSGGMGISPGQAARLVVEGVLDANERLVEVGWPRVARLMLTELFMDRSTEAWRALRPMANANPRRIALVDAVSRSAGGLSRPLDSTYRGAEYDLFSAITRDDGAGGTSVVYTLDTRRARTEVRATSTQSRLLKKLIKSASNADNSDARIGRTMFQLLIPRELVPFLGGGSEMQIEVDSGTAGIPWELLDNTAGDPSAPRLATGTKPWAIRARLLRKLRIADFRARVADAGRDAKVLVIGEPYCDDPRYPRLPGARAEGDAVANMAAKALGYGQVRALVAKTDDEVGADARTIVSALLERDWRVLHVSGHGEPPEPETAKATMGDRLRGVVLSDGIFLGPREIGMLEHTPELVFINCCHLARRAEEQWLKESASQYDRPYFAATVAEELVRIGVKCVIAAGWAVDDLPAQTFATVFYTHLLDGERFIDAVFAARQAAWLQGGNTWAAYQCYGDPNWVLQCSPDTTTARKRPPEERYASVSSEVSLLLALEEFENNARYQTAYPTDSLAWLEQHFGERWAHLGNVAEAFAMAWREAGVNDRAIAWFERAIAAADGRASFRASDTLANLRARAAFTRLKSQATRSPQGWQAPQAALDAARHDIDASIRQFEALLAVQSSSERQSLCGSAYKRLAMVERIAGKVADETQALVAMKARYAEAEKLASALDEHERCYAFINRLVAELVAYLKSNVAGYDASDVAILHDLLDRSCGKRPEFWCVAGRAELQLYDSVKAGNVSTTVDAVLDALRNLRMRIGSRQDWSSVLDQWDFVLTAYASRDIGEQESAACERLLSTLEEWVKQK